jgi:PDZ domain-containing protein
MGVALVILALLPTKYVSVSPRRAEPVNPHVTITGTPSFEPEGEFLYLTVSISSQRLRRIEWLRAKLDDTVDLVDEELITRGRSRGEVREQARLQIDDSKLTAEVVALAYVGRDVGFRGTGVTIVEIGTEAPSSAVLAAGDTIVAIDGSPVMIDSDIGPILADRRQGDSVEVTFERPVGAGTETETLTEAVTLSEVVDEETGAARAIIGIAPSTRDLELDVPYTIEIDTGEVGGPSAGLAFTLALIDELTEGELTGGQTIAITGAIGFNCEVQDVGGVKQKAVAARRAGAVAMLVPPGELDEALKQAGDMEVVAVETLPEAIEVIGRLGGDISGLPSRSEAEADCASR